MGEVCMIPPSLRCCLGQRMVLLRPSADKVDPRYLLFALQSPVVRHEILVNEGTGSTVSNLRIPVLESLPIPIPPMADQRAIGEILGSLDEKIDLNRSMNTTLEAMARAVFQAWFMDCEPVRAKVSELGKEGILEIGDGYRAKNSELAAEGLPFVRAGNLNGGFDLDGAELLCPQSVAKVGNKISRAGDVAFTSKGTVGRLARVPRGLPSFVYSPQICFWRSLAPDRLHPAILYCWMASQDFQDQVSAVSHQTDMAPYISLRDQRELSVPRFPGTQDQVGERIDLLLSKQAFNQAENRTLAAVRDALLPKLMSGEVRVRP
jgi:type I restriction enzyme S subunit